MSNLRCLSRYPPCRCLVLEVFDFNTLVHGTSFGGSLDGELFPLPPQRFVSDLTTTHRSPPDTLDVVGSSAEPVVVLDPHSHSNSTSLVVFEVPPSHPYSSTPVLLSSSRVSQSLKAPENLFQPESRIGSTVPAHNILNDSFPAPTSGRWSTGVPTLTDLLPETHPAAFPESPVPPPTIL